MKDIPNHISPVFTLDLLDNTLFHYTTANGLLGIFKENALWSTAYYCANDEDELATGKGIITRIFREETERLHRVGDHRIQKFYDRGVDPFDCAEKFEDFILSLTLSKLCPYITCFCQPKAEDDFTHGLLSQWRAYGHDGGYALQFNRNKIEKALEDAFDGSPPHYDFKGVCYERENALRDQVFFWKEFYVLAFNNYLDELASPLSFQKKVMESPVSNLLGGPIESLRDFLIHTKNKHFFEENECRLSSIRPVSSSTSANYYNRNGLLVPYITTREKGIDILGCLEWIVVGPGPRSASRFKSVNQLVIESDRDIKVRISHIPFTRI